jgi:hypothetical protein
MDLQNKNFVKPKLNSTCPKLLENPNLTSPKYLENPKSQYQKTYDPGNLHGPKEMGLDST